jgi:hypothetical protein
MQVARKCSGDHAAHTQHMLQVDACHPTIQVWEQFASASDEGVNLAERRIVSTI